MAKSKKVDKTIAYYVLGGAALGAIAGYIVKKVGVKNAAAVVTSLKIDKNCLWSFEISLSWE